MKTVTTRRHQITVPVDWNATLKKQLAAILEAKLGPAFGPEHDDEVGEAPLKCQIRPYFPAKDEDSPSLRMRPIWADEDDEDGDGRRPSFGDDDDEEEEGGGWRGITRLLRKRNALRIRFGDEDDRDGCWHMPAACKPLPASSNEGTGGWSLFPRIVCGPEGQDGGWAAPIRCLLSKLHRALRAITSLWPLCGPKDGGEPGWSIFPRIVCGPEGQDGGWDAPLKAQATRSFAASDAPVRQITNADERDYGPDWDAPAKCCQPSTPLFGPDGGGEPGWSAAKIWFRSFPLSEDENRRLTSNRVLFGPEGPDDGWDALMNRIRFGDDADDDGDWEAPVTCRQLRIKFGDEDDRGPGWSKLALFQPSLQQREAGPATAFLPDRFGPSHVPHAPRVAVLALPGFGREGEED